MPVNISDEQLDEWVAEAEAGYDVDELKSRGRGRPGRGVSPSQVVAIRLTDEELKSLDRAAGQRDVSRSELVRQAIAAFTR